MWMMSSYGASRSLLKVLCALFTLILIGLPIAGAEIPGYPDYRQIEDELAYLNDTYPEICALHRIGTTYEGRAIWALKISDNAWKDEGEPKVLIMGGHHAKELISTVVPLMFAEFLLDNYSSNGTVKNAIDSTDIWIVPLVNPDGYEYVMEGHTDWRKNRRPVDIDGDGIVDGTGVDINRNYAHRWGQQGISLDPNSEIYCGPHAFSENESRAIRDLALNRSFVFSISFHSYGQQIFHPWGNSLDSAPLDFDLMDSIGERMARYNGYDVMEGWKWYNTTGDSDDWLYANTSCLPFTVELGKEYIPPPHDISRIFEKNRDALLYLLSIASDPYVGVYGERTNLRISDFSVKDGIAGITVENQGNYSVSARLTLSSENWTYTFPRFVLAPASALNLSVEVSGAGKFLANIEPVHHTEEWNLSDNSAVFTIEEIPHEKAADPLMYVFGSVILLFFLLSYGYKSLKKH